MRTSTCRSTTPAFADATRSSCTARRSSCSRRWSVRTCKLQHGTVRRLADLDARLQAQFIADHRDAVDAQKQADDESLRRAVEYLEQHGWDVPGRDRSGAG